MKGIIILFKPQLYIASPKTKTLEDSRNTGHYYLLYYMYLVGAQLRNPTKVSVYTRVEQEPR